MQQERNERYSEICASIAQKLLDGNNEDNCTQTEQRSLSLQRLGYTILACPTGLTGERSTARPDSVQQNKLSQQIKNAAIQTDEDPKLHSTQYIRQSYESNIYQSLQQQCGQLAQRLIEQQHKKDVPVNDVQLPSPILETRSHSTHGIDSYDKNTQTEITVNDIDVMLHELAEISTRQQEAGAASQKQLGKSARHRENLLKPLAETSANSELYDLQSEPDNVISRQSNERQGWKNDEKLRTPQLQSVKRNLGSKLSQSETQFTTLNQSLQKILQSDSQPNEKMQYKTDIDIIIENQKMQRQKQFLSLKQLPAAENIKTPKPLEKLTKRKPKQPANQQYQEPSFPEILVKSNARSALGNDDHELQQQNEDTCADAENRQAMHHQSVFQISQQELHGRKSLDSITAYQQKQQQAISNGIRNAPKFQFDIRSQSSTFPSSPQHEIQTEHQQYQESVVQQPASTNIKLMPSPRIINYKHLAKQNTYGATSQRGQSINYKLEGNKFISPFFEAIKYRNMRKLIQKSRKRANRQKDAQNKTDCQQNSSMCTAPRKAAEPDGILYYLQSFWPNQPRIFSTSEYCVLKLYYRVDKIGKSDSLFVYAPSMRMQSVISQKDVVCAEVGQCVSFVDVCDNSIFKNVFQQYKIQLFQINKTKCAIKAVAKSQLMPLGWVKRAIRLFYFEAKQTDQQIVPSFLRWATNRFPSQLSFQHFICVFYAALLWHSRTDAEVRSFYVLLEQNVQYQKLHDILLMRQQFGLDQGNPLTVRYEDQDSGNYASDAKVATFIQNNIFNENHAKIFQQYSEQISATPAQAIYLVQCYENQSLLKQIAGAIRQYVGISGEQTMSRQKFQVVLQSIYPFLNDQEVSSLLCSVADQRNSNITVRQFISVFMDLNRLAQQSDNLQTDCERKLQICENILQRLVNNNMISDGDALKIEQIRQESKLDVARHHGVVASCKIQQYYAMLLSVKRSRAGARDDDEQHVEQEPERQ